MIQMDILRTVIKSRYEMDPIIQRISKASAESLKESGFEIVSRGEPISIFAQYGGKVTDGSRQTMGQVFEII